MAPSMSAAVSAFRGAMGVWLRVWCLVGAAFCGATVNPESDRPRGGQAGPIGELFVEAATRGFPATRWCTPGRVGFGLLDQPQCGRLVVRVDRKGRCGT